MKSLLAVLLVAAATHSAMAADAAASAPAASAPAAHKGPVPPAENPAVRASKQATIPGDYRPQRQTVPQLSIPLGKTKQSAPAQPGGGIDDSVARCLAKRTSQEREDCEAGLDKN